MRCCLHAAGVTHATPLRRPCTPQAGAFKIGDAAGTLDNIVACKLYRPGSVGGSHSRRTAGLSAAARVWPQPTGRRSLLQLSAHRKRQLTAALCRSHTPQVGFVSKSGGMSNELYNVIARAADGIFEGEPQGC